jgi:glycosyltransferase involved in cell wall biosynthesis
MKVSVLYISNRYGSIDILKASLDRQTFTDFELVFIDGLKEDREKEVLEYFSNSEYPVIYKKEPVKPEGALMNLTFAINEGFRQCSGELIVLLQDFIYVPYDGIEKFVYLTDKLGKNVLLTGISHQYDTPEKEEITNTKGLITIFDKEYKTKPTNRGWTDPRFIGNYDLREAQPIEWETNWASIPRSVVYDLGGVDESYAYNGFNMDNLNLSERAKILGYKIYLDPSNEVFCFHHFKWFGNKFAEAKQTNDVHHFKTMNAIHKGELPVRLNYLS